MVSSVVVVVNIVTQPLLTGSWRCTVQETHPEATAMCKSY